MKPHESVRCALMLLSVAACSNVDRSLIFFTNTTTGIEVSASGSSSDPVRLIIGYKRQEGVLNPVYDANGIETVSHDVNGKYSERVKKYRDEAYSVLAKYQGGSSGSASEAAAAASNAQWFATGRAATILAGQPGIAGAVTGSAAIAEGAAKQAIAQVRLGGATREANVALLEDLYDWLVKMRDDRKDDAAHGLVARLDKLDASPYQITFTNYVLNGDKLTKQALPSANANAPFRHVTSLWDDLNQSIRDLDTALSSGAAISEPPSTTAISSARRDELRKELNDTLRPLRDDFEQRLAKEPAVLDSIDYLIKQLQSE